MTVFTTQKNGFDVFQDLIANGWADELSWQQPFYNHNRRLIQLYTCDIRSPLKYNLVSNQITCIIVFSTFNSF